VLARSSLYCCRSRAWPLTCCVCCWGWARCRGVGCARQRAAAAAWCVARRSRQRRCATRLNQQRAPQPVLLHTTPRARAHARTHTPAHLEEQHVWVVARDLAQLGLHRLACVALGREKVDNDEAAAARAGLALHRQPQLLQAAHIEHVGRAVHLPPVGVCFYGGALGTGRRGVGVASRRHARRSPSCQRGRMLREVGRPKWRCWARQWPCNQDPRQGQPAAGRALGFRAPCCSVAIVAPANANTPAPAVLQRSPGRTSRLRHAFRLVGPPPAPGAAHTRAARWG
jgi:hypothetical protein